MKRFMKTYRKKILIILAVVLGVGLFGGVEIYDYITEPKTIVSYEQYMDDLTHGRIDTVYYKSGENMMKYTLLNEDTKKMSVEEREKYHYKSSEYRKTDFVGGENFRENVLKYNVHVVKQTPFLSKTAIEGLVSALFSFVLFLFVLNEVKTIIGDEKQEKENDNPQKIKFDEVIGHEEIIEDLRDLTKFIQKSDELKKQHARMPKGVLLVGPPGTGKTMLAKAMATEADVPFIYREASSFVDRFAGVGPRNVRNLFKEARKKAPCIVFIDEIDAVVNRSDSTSDTEDKRTVNALLTELDGFDSEHEILVLAATNNADALDKALTRSGRFDRRIQVNPPRDTKTRVKLLEHYLKDVKTEELNLTDVARGMAGFTGADISTIVNEAILISIAKESEVVCREHIDEAVDKHLLQGKRLKKKQLEEDRKRIAYHEAGHAVMSYLAEQKISRISIESNTSGVGGFVLREDTESSFQTKKELEDQIHICYAGRIAEEIFFGKEQCTNGASNDISRATHMLQEYVMEYGFSERFGLMNLELLQERGNMQEWVLQELLQISKEMEETTRKQLEMHRNKVERLAKALLEQDTLLGEEVEALL